MKALYGDWLINAFAQNKTVKVNRVKLADGTIVQLEAPRELLIQKKMKTVGIDTAEYVDPETKKTDYIKMPTINQMQNFILAQGRTK